MRTLRGRLFAHLALASLVSAVLTIAVAAPLTGRYLEDRTLDDMQRRAEQTTALLSSFTTPGAKLRLERSFLIHGERLFLPGSPSPVARALLARGQERGTVQALDREFLFVVVETGDGPLVLAREGGLELTPFLTGLVLAGLGGAAVAALLAYFLARRLLRPVSAVAGASRRLAEGEVGVRVPVEGGDELAGLASSFNAMAEDVERAREAERTFLLSVSHELKTPLTAIRGYAEAVRDGAVPPDEAGVVIGAEAERLERLVGDLMDLARLDARRFSVDVTAVDLSDVAREVERRYAARAAGFAVGLDVEASGDATWAAADRDRLIQVVSNLVENALRVTPAGGQVTIACMSAGVEVRDTGPGIAADDLPRAFERFHLHERSATQHPVGSGLGLAIVKELTEAMGGSVAVESREGQGTTFGVRLRPAGPAGL